MPVTLTNAQIAKLDEEQLEAYARVHLDSERSRRKLCDLAAGRNRSLWIPALALAAATIALIWFPTVLRDPFNLTFIAITILVCLHTRTNRRIDALVQLLDLDRIETKKKTEQVGAGDAEEAV